MGTESKALARAIAEGAEHHRSAKTYSGMLMRPHVPYIAAMIRSIGIESALDVGCGKGDQYRWRDPLSGGLSVEERWGFAVRKYDPCYGPYAAEPEGRFDLVICTHTLSLVPTADQAWFLDRLFGWARKAVFIAEKIGERKKAEVADPAERAIGWRVAEWLDRIAAFADQWPDIATVFSSRERVGDETVTIRHRRVGGEWFAERAGPP